MDDILQKLIGMMNEIMPDTDTSKVTEETNLATDLGIDSLNMMILAISVEDLFGITLGEGFMPVTVGDLCRRIREVQAKA